jgi:hypothetical protein
MGQEHFGSPLKPHEIVRALSMVRKTGTRLIPHASGPRRGIVGQPITWELDGKQYVTITNGATGPYVMRAGDPKLANIPAGGSIWTFKLFEEYSGPQSAASAN